MVLLDPLSLLQLFLLSTTALRYKPFRVIDRPLKLHTWEPKVDIRQVGG